MMRRGHADEPRNDFLVVLEEVIEVVVDILRVTSYRAHGIPKMAVVEQDARVLFQSGELRSCAGAAAVIGFAVADGVVGVAIADYCAKGYGCDDFVANLLVQGRVLDLGAIKDSASTPTQHILRYRPALRKAQQHEFTVRTLLTIRLHLRLSIGRPRRSRLAPSLHALGRTLGRILHILKPALLLADARANLPRDVAQASWVGLIGAAGEEEVERGAFGGCPGVDFGRVARDRGRGRIAAFLRERDARAEDKGG